MTRITYEAIRASLADLNQRKVEYEYCIGSVSYLLRLRLAPDGIFCPTCGEVCKVLTEHPAGRGMVCPVCASKGRRS
jgi:hypothetical protein